MWAALQQAAELPWHRQGMFLGMHWAWWSFWFATVVVLIWALWRVHAERVEARRDAAVRLSAEELLRQRFARGEISEEEYVAKLRVLSDAGAVGAGGG